MKRKFAIAQHANLIGVQGLEQTIDQPTDYSTITPSPLLWKLSNSKKPEYLRWSWNPVTGELLIGNVHRHANHIITDRYPFDAWCRGFYFVKENHVVVRTYHWPLESCEDYDADGNDRVSMAIVSILCGTLKNASVKYNATNDWLLQTYYRYSTSW